MMPATLVALAILILGMLIAPRATSSRSAARAHPARAVGDVSPIVARMISRASRRWSVRSRRRTPCAPEAVASWCDAVARSVRAGSTLRAAVATVQPDDRSVGAVIGDLQLGLERGDALAAVMRRDPAHEPDRHLDAARDVISVIADLGGSSAAPLDRAAAALRMRAADDRERAAQAAQARMSSKVLTVVPIAVLVVIVATDPDVVRVVTQPVGATCVALGLVLNITGNRWMRRMVEGAR